MAIQKVVVVDGNNLIVRIDRGVAGRGVTDVEPVEISGSLYLVFTFSDGTTETVGPVGTVAYVGQSPIVVTASTISLSTVPVNLGGTGQITANAGFNALAPTQTGNTGKYLKTDGTNSSWDLLDISTADITGVLPISNGGTNASTISAARTNLGLGTIATQNANAIAITGGTITGITDLAVADGGTGSSTAAGAMVNLLPSYTGNANKRLGLDGTATGLEWVTDGGGTVTSIDVSGGTTGMSFTGGPVTTSGTITLSGTLDLDNGGTGATTASGARTNLNAADQATTISAGTGLSGGGDLSANRTLSIANTAVTAAAYGSASNTLTATVNAQGQLTALAATPIAIANTQISGLGTMSTQNANAVAITGGSITGITDLAVADGGTGASDAAGARTNLNAADQATTITAGTGLSGGGNLSANRTIDIANTTVTAGAFGSASNTLTATVNAQGQLTALAATPIAIANTQVSGLGTMSTQNSNAVTITGGSITGITDLALADGGTGASNAPDARSNLGLGSAAVLNAGVALGVATLDAGGTVPLSQIPASIQGGVSYQGAWNASTNTPTLTSSVGSKGYYYVVSVAGNTNLNGVTDWLVGDWAIFNGTAWEKIDNTDQVASVNGYTGVVVLSNTDVGAPPTSLTISAGTGLSGGGSLAANRTISIANTTVTAAPYGTASAVPTFTVNGQGQLTAASDVTIAIANTQVSGLGTMSTQNANSVAITGGSITGITDLAIADGGTGASTAGGALTNLGAIGSITSTDGSIVVTPSGTTVNLAVSEASPASTLLTQVRNTTGATLTKGTVVYISGATGQISTVSKAIASGDSTSAQTLGMMTSNLANNTNGYVTVFGLLENMDTSAYTDGAQLYLSGTVAGAVTATKPSAPIHLVYVAVVEYAHPTQGKLLVKVQNGYELDEIHDVSIVTPVTGQTLVYNSSTDLWVNNTVSLTAGVNGTLPILNGGTGQTTANAAFNALAPSQTGNSGKYLTTDGTDTSWASNPLGTVTSVAASVPSFLSIAGSPITTSGTLAISLSGTALPTTSGGTGLTSFTSGGVVYASSSSALATGSALTFDGTKLSVGSGASTSAGLISGYFGASGYGAIWSTGVTPSTSNFAFLTNGSSTVINGSSGVTIQANNADAVNIGSTGNVLIGATSNTAGARLISENVTGNQLGLRYSSVATWYNSIDSSGNYIWNKDGTEYVRISSTGNVGIGTSSPAQKLHVVGAIASTGQASSLTASSAFFDYLTSSNSARFAAVGNTTGTAAPIIFSQYSSNASVGRDAATIDSSGNLGLGVAPSAWDSSYYTAIQFANNGASLSAWNTALTGGKLAYLSNNLYQTYTGGVGPINRYVTTGNTTAYRLSDGEHQWLVAPSGTAGGVISYTQAMTLDGSGQLVIGATSASSRLHVTGSANTYAGSGLLLGTAGLASGYIWTTDNLYIKPNQSAGTASGSVNFQNYGGANSVSFNTTTANALTLDSSGRFMIGTTTPLDIATVVMNGSSNGNGITVRAVNSTAAGSQPGIVFASSAGAICGNVYADVGSVSLNLNNGSGGSIRFLSNSSESARFDTSGNFIVGGNTAFSPSAGRGNVSINGTTGCILGLGISNSQAGYLFHDGTHLSLVNDRNGYLSFATNGTPRGQFDSTGNLLVGASFTSTYAACTGKLNVLFSSGSTATPTIAVLNPDATAAFIAFSDTATVFGSITRSVSAVLYNTTSDQRLKENIVDADSASNLIDSLQVRKFDWKADGNHQRYGFVAQELVTVAPEAVYQPNDADAMMAVDYSKLVPMLVKEIQSLRARVLQLETN